MTTCSGPACNDTSEEIDLERNRDRGRAAPTWVDPFSVKLVHVSFGMGLMTTRMSVEVAMSRFGGDVVRGVGYVQRRQLAINRGSPEMTERALFAESLQ